MFMVPGIKGFVATGLVKVHSEEFWQEFALYHKIVPYYNVSLSIRSDSDSSLVDP